MSESPINLKKWGGSTVLVYVALAVITIVFSLPVLWMLASSLKPDDQMLADANRLLPRVMELDPVEDRTNGEVSIFQPAYWRAIGIYAKHNYLRAWNSPVADFPLYLKNTLIISSLSVLGMVISSSIVAYGFARIRWRGRNTLFVVVLATMMIPFPVLMAPLYIVFRHLGWIGTFKPLWVPAWFGGAFSIFLLRQFFLSIPRQLDEAAMLDGCSHFGIFRRIILPLSKPALAVVVLFQFVATWNDFVGPLIFLNHQEQYTLALGLYMYQSQQGATPWNLLMAASCLVVLPVLVVFLLTQRTFLQGITTRGIRR